MYAKTASFTVWRIAVLDATVWVKVVSAVILRAATPPAEEASGEGPLTLAVSTECSQISQWLLRKRRLFTKV